MQEHPTRRAARLADRKITAQVVKTFDCEPAAGGFCGPEWKKAQALADSLRAAPSHVALLDAAARAPLYAEAA